MKARALRVGEHAPDLAADLGGVAQVARLGPGQQLVIGHAGPEEIRQARGQLEPTEPAGGARAGVNLGAEEEVGRDQHRGQRDRDPHLELSPVPAGQIDEAQVGGQLVGGDCPAEGAPGEPLDDGRPQSASAVAGGAHTRMRARTAALAGAGIERVLDAGLGGGQVLLDPNGRDAEHVAVVVEAVAELVGQELEGARQPQVDPQQVADGVVVFGGVEPPGGHPAGAEGRGAASAGSPPRTPRQELPSTRAAAAPQADRSRASSGHHSSGGATARPDGRQSIPSGTVCGEIAGLYLKSCSPRPRCHRRPKIPRSSWPGRMRTGSARGSTTSSSAARARPAPSCPGAWASG